MYVGSAEAAVALARDVKKLATVHTWCDMVLVPAFPHIWAVASLIKNSAVRVGAQTLSMHENGAHTGEVSAAILKNAGVSLVIVGHSERRMAGETDATIRGQLSAAQRLGLRVVLCVGERERDVEHGAHFEYLSEQVRSALADLVPRDAAKIIIAYEPLWAIGKSGQEAVPPAVLRETAIFIRKILADICGPSAALKVPLLYGGSVTPENIAALFTEGGVQGFLVGRGSVDVARYAAMLAALAPAQKLISPPTKKNTKHKTKNRTKKK